MSIRLLLRCTLSNACWATARQRFAPGDLLMRPHVARAVLDLLGVQVGAQAAGPTLSRYLGRPELLQVARYGAVIDWRSRTADKSALTPRIGPWTPCLRAL